LHETSSHCVCFVLYTEKKISPDRTRVQVSSNLRACEKIRGLFPMSTLNV
jgi:hypothetical protein